MSDQLSALVLDFEKQRERRYRAALTDTDYARKLSADNSVDALLRLFNVDSPEKIPFQSLPKYRAELTKLIQLNMKSGA